MIGNTNTPADECSGATMEAGETKTGTPETAMAATAEAQATRYREADGHAVVVQAVVLFVRVDPDNGEHDRENEERHEHDADGHLAHTTAVYRHTGAAQLPHAIGGLARLVRRGHG